MPYNQKNIMIRRSLIFLFLAILLLTLTGCGRSQTELPTLPPNPIPTLLPTCSA